VASLFYEVGRPRFLLAAFAESVSCRTCSSVKRFSPVLAVLPLLEEPALLLLEFDAEAPAAAPLVLPAPPALPLLAPEDDMFSVTLRQLRTTSLQRGGYVRYKIPWRHTLRGTDSAGTMAAEYAR
jgi:hypothetical protein